MAGKRSETTVEPSAAEPEVNFPLIYGKLISVALFWGGTFVAGRMLAQSIPSMIAATGRYAVACVLLLFLAWKLEGGLPKLKRSQILTTFILGFTGIFIYNICFFFALAIMPAGRTALLVALSPIATALLQALLFRERLGSLGWVGIATAFCGTAIVVTRGNIAGTVQDISQSIGLGELVMLCAVLSWSVYTILGRFVLKELTPIAATTYASLWGLMLLGLSATLEIGSFDTARLTWQVWSAVVYLGVIGTVVAFIWYYDGVRTIGSSRTAVFNNLVPVFGVLLAALLLSETILVSMVVGGALTLAGVLFANGTHLKIPAFIRFKTPR